MKRKLVNTRNDSKSFWKALKRAQKLKAKGKKVEVVYTPEHGWKPYLVKPKEGKA